MRQLWSLIVQHYGLTELSISTTRKDTALNTKTPSSSYRLLN